MKVYKQGFNCSFRKKEERNDHLQFCYLFSNCADFFFPNFGIVFTEKKKLVTDLQCFCLFIGDYFERY